MPSRPLLLSCAGFALGLVVLGQLLGRDFISPTYHPLRYLYPAAFAWLAWAAWRARKASPQNRLALIALALGMLTFPARFPLTRDVILSHVDYVLANGPRLLAVALVQMVQVVVFGVISLIVALAIERSAILRQSLRLQQAEARIEKGRRLESLGEMAARIAHDFNNLLSAISMGVELARGAKANPAQVDAELEVVEEVTERATGLVRQLVAFANPHTAAHEAVTAFDVTSFLDRSEQVLHRLMQRGIVLNISAAASEAWVSMPASQFEQVLVNLVVNARDASPAGSTINVETATEEFAVARVIGEGALPAGTYLRTSVHDSGSGIPADVLPRIFDPFFSTKGSQGTGLGLATVYSIVHRALGDVVVHSELGRGTRFDVFLPLVQRPSNQAA